MSFEGRERPLGVALVAAWFILGAVALLYLLFRLYRAMEILTNPLGDAILMIAIGGGVLLTIGLFVIAAGVWRGAKWSRTAACSILLATAAVALWKGTAAPNLIVAAGNICAFAYLLLRKPETEAPHVV